jgi:solute carrier family 35 protein C2
LTIKFLLKTNFFITRFFLNTKVFEIDVKMSSFLAVSVMIGAVVAFAMELSEYLLVCKTSSLTLSIASVWKEVLTLFLDFRINKSRFSATNILGLVLCFVGIIVHLVIKVGS